MRPLHPPQPVPARVSRPTHSTVVLPHAADSSMRPTVTPLHQQTVVDGANASASALGS